MWSVCVCLCVSLGGHGASNMLICSINCGSRASLRWTELAGPFVVISNQMWVRCEHRVTSTAPSPYYSLQTNKHTHPHTRTHSHACMHARTHTHTRPCNEERGGGGIWQGCSSHARRNKGPPIKSLFFEPLHHRAKGAKNGQEEGRWGRGREGSSAQQITWARQPHGTNMYEGKTRECGCSRLPLTVE